MGDLSVALGKLRDEVDQLKREMAHVRAWMPWHSYPTKYAAMHDVANLKLHIVFVLRDNIIGQIRYNSHGYI